MKFTKEQARKKLLTCARQYHLELLDTNLLIIYRDKKDNVVRYIEVVFLDRNYQHLTGVELIDKEGRLNRNQSVNFYRKCIENKLAVNEIRFKNDGTTHLKLAALSTFMNITKVTKIAGEYNYIRPYLSVDKLIGGVNYCLGLTKVNGIYVPSSVLFEDIKSLTDMPCQVLAIMQKDIHEHLYQSVKYVTKGLNLNNIHLSEELCQQINLNHHLHFNNEDK